MIMIGMIEHMFTERDNTNRLDRAIDMIILGTSEQIKDKNVSRYLQAWEEIHVNSDKEVEFLPSALQRASSERMK